MKESGNVARVRLAREMVTEAIRFRDRKDWIGEVYPSEYSKAYSDALIMASVIIVTRTKGDQMRHAFEEYYKGADVQGIMEIIAWKTVYDEYNDRLIAAEENGVDLDDEPDEWHYDIWAEVCSDTNVHGEEGL